MHVKASFAEEWQVCNASAGGKYVMERFLLADAVGFWAADDVFLHGALHGDDVHDDALHGQSWRAAQKYR
jgi:hypothetical protein